MKHHQDNMPNKPEAQAPEQAQDQLGADLAEMEKTVAELKQELETAQKKIEESHNTALRFRADVENMRRQAERDVANAHKFSVEKFAGALLPILDSLEQGIASIEKDQALHQADAKYHSICEGMKMTFKLFTDMLAKFQITVIAPLGEAFNPHLHEAMTAQPSEEEPGTILAVFQKGYQIHDRLLRPARVVVAK